MDARINNIKSLFFVEINNKLKHDKSVISRISNLQVDEKKQLASSHPRLLHSE